MCVDYRDLNRASPKDDFPLPHIDVLVDNTTKSKVFSFMDGFSGYNQIKMAVEDREKMTAAAEAVIALSENNKKIIGKQIITCDSGVCVILIAPNKSIMRKLQAEVKDSVIEEVEKINSERRIRVGIGSFLQH